jgi:Ca2+-binding RTX toxin-like protein
LHREINAFSGTLPVLKLSGDNAGDKITGTRFADRIEGGNGKDTLSGFDGNDVLLGGNGDDVLNGGRGNDTLTGGNGPDEFVFWANFGNDIITDFSKPDKINLSKLSLNSSALDSNRDGVINRQDNIASTINGSLVLNLTALNGGTITFKDVTSVNMAAVIL